MKCFVDNIVITGRNTKEHMENLKNVLVRLRQFGLRLRKDKCVFFFKEKLNI